MERIKEALEKARQERQIRQGGDTVTSPGTPRQDAGETGASQTQTISVDDALLRENRIVTGLEPGPFTDANNLLRTQVLQRFKENNWNVLAVTSPGEGEGKTLTAINLAISIAREVDYTVLLVDANLRHPWMLEHLGLAHRKGLSDYLTDDTPISELLIQAQPCGAPGDSAGRAAADQLGRNAEFAQDGATGQGHEVPLSQPHHYLRPAAGADVRRCPRLLALRGRRLAGDRGRRHAKTRD